MHHLKLAKILNTHSHIQYKENYKGHKMKKI